VPTSLRPSFSAFLKHSVRYVVLLALVLLSISPAHTSNLSISDQTRFLTPSQNTTPSTLYIPDELQGTPIGANMLYLEDAQHRHSIHSLLEKPQDWQQIERTSPNFGFTSSAYWFKFDIDNPTENEPSVYLEITLPFLDKVELYQLESGKIIQQHVVGDTYPFDERPVTHQNFVLPYTLHSGKNEFLMRIASSGTVEAPIVLWDVDKHAIFSANDNLLQGIWAGVIAIMVVYNLLLFFSIRELSYLYYVIFAFSFLLFQVSLKGYGFAYLWPESLEWNSFAISVFIGGSNLSILLLIVEFLKLRTTTPYAYRVMQFLIVVSAISFVLSFIVPYSITIRLNSTLALINCSVSMILGYISLFRGLPDARYYCLAWTATFIGLGILGLVKFGVLPANIYTNNAGQIGIVFLVSLLSLALAGRINREKEMRLDAQESMLSSEMKLRESQEELLKTQTSINAQLESKVKERTQSMQRALTELEQANNRLELASTTDSLTTLFNRRHFESRLHIELKRAERHDRELSVILCDLDRFKSINDNYGHKTGDECLRHAAVILKNTITRSGDIIARYGGEEFIILLVDTSVSEAEHVANTLCKAFANSAFESNGNIIEFTASFGVSSISQKAPKSADELVTRADIAMYEAKNDGRNQVKLWKETDSPNAPQT
jgi:diguanylate cyclase (GGDEF)-like protein